MRLRRNRWLASLLAFVPLLAAFAGCNGGTDIPLKQAPLVQIPESKAPEAQPKHLRPRAGSSAGMGYDPSGMTPK